MDPLPGPGLRDRPWDLILAIDRAAGYRAKRQIRVSAANHDFRLAGAGNLVIDELHNHA